MRFEPEKSLSTVHGSFIASSKGEIARDGTLEDGGRRALIEDRNWDSIYRSRKTDTKPEFRNGIKWRLRLDHRSIIGSKDSLLILYQLLVNSCMVQTRL